MANFKDRSFLPSCNLTLGRILFSFLAVFVLTAFVNAQDTVSRTNSSGTVTGTDVATVQTATGAAEGDVLTISGTATHNSLVAPVHTFTIQSSNSTAQTINAGTAGCYNLAESGAYTITLSNLNYQGNSTALTKDGGFMYINNTGATPTLTLNNASFSGFKLGNDKHGGVICVNQGTLTINSTGTLSFSNNNATGSDGRGAAIYGYTGSTQNNVSINGETIDFSNNTATIGGGAVARTNLTLTGSTITFNNNRANNNDGGAFHSGKLTITGKDSTSSTTFEGNSANYIGGAVSSSDVTFSTGSFYFINNTGRTYNANGRAGAVSSTTFTVTNAETLSFTGNTSASKCGALYATGDISISAKTVKFESNKTTASSNSNGKGGGIYAEGGNVTIDANTITFEKNSAVNYGAAIRVDSSKNLKISGTNITFEKNTVSSNDGGAISGSTLTITGKSPEAVTTFKENSAKYIGGAIGAGDITFSTGSFSFQSNKATTYHDNAKGGAICGGVIKITNAEDVSFTDNTGTRLGGAIYATSLEISGKNITFSGNKAAASGQTNGQGGAIYCTGSVTFSGANAVAEFSGNSATAANAGNDLYLSGTGGLTFQNNGTYSFDGGIYMNNTNKPATVINQAQVTIAGRANDSTNKYQFFNVNISNGGSLTANLDYIDSLTGTFNVGLDGSAGTLEFNVGADVAKELTLSETFGISGSETGSVVKSGAGALTLNGNYSYDSPTTVSGGTLLIPTNGTSLATSKVTVASDSEATFQTGASLSGVAFELGEGGTFVIGETSASKDITIGALTLDGGTIRFDFNDPAVLDDGYNIDTDWLHVSTASLSSGVIDLSFNNSSEEAWWNVIKNNYGDEGFEIITGQIPDYENFNSSNVQVAVNGALSSDWTLTATEAGLFLLTKADEQPWYYANTDDTEATSWTIDGTSKLGVQFTEGDSMTASYGGNITMSGDGEFNVGTGRTLTLGGVISDEGDVTKTGEGILKLTGANTYTGKTIISDGTLEVNNNFTSSSGLAGSGTLKLSGDRKFFDIGDASGFTGTVQVFDDDIAGEYRVQLAGANGTTSTNIDLSNATVVINGNKTSGKFSEVAFYKGASTLKIGTLNGNEYGRILNTDGTTTTATFNNLIVGNGNYAGEIGRSTNNTSYPYVNHINLTKADDGSETGGTLTLSAKYLSYMGTTTIEGGTLEITNNLSGSNYQYFARTTGLKGSGTLSFTGSNWTVFSLDGTNGSALQDFDGTINAAAKVMITNEARDAVRTLNLGNATLNVKSNGLIGLHGVKNSAVSNLTVKELNVEEGGVIRICSNDPGNNYGTLTAARGLISGTLGQENTVWNKVNLVKVSDGTESGGTLTIEGQNYFTGTTTVSGGTLKLTGNAVAANGPITVENGSTLEFNVASGSKKLELSASNAIFSTGTGQIVKTGAGTLQFDADENSFDAKDLVLAEGRLDFKGTMNGNITVSNGVFSPGNSVGTTNISGNVVITDSGKALFEFSPYNNGEGEFDVLNIVNGTAENAFTVDDNMIQMIQLQFVSEEDASFWADALENDPTGGYKLVSDEGFTSLGDLSSWLDNNYDLFGLEGRTDGLYLIGLGAGPGPGPGPGPGSGVPEPSTWALLALGVVVLFLRKRVRN